MLLIFRLHDEDDKAAKVGVTEITLEPTCYEYPDNPKIKFWDLPGIGTPSYPDLETYWKKVLLANYPAFLIFTKDRFTECDKQLAQKIRLTNKRFFFIRSKIDVDVEAEKRSKRSFNEAAMLKEIHSYCSENLHGLLEKEEDVFFISCHYPAKWDFARLTQAILHALPNHQRESLTLSLSILTSLSTDVLKKKVEILQERMWKVASASAAVTVVPIPPLPIAIDLVVIRNEISFYRSQLGLPEEGSKIFANLSDGTQQEVKEMLAMLADVLRIAKLLSISATEQVAEEVTRTVPIVGCLAAGALAWAATYYFLKNTLKKMEEVALLVLKEAAAVDNFATE